LIEQNSSLDGGPHRSWKDRLPPGGRGATTFSKLGVQCLGLGYCTEQNMDGIPSFVHCSLQLRKKLGWSVQFFFFGGGSAPRPPQWLRPCPEAGCTLRKFSALTTPLSATPAVAVLLYTVIQLVCLFCVYSALNVVISEPVVSARPNKGGRQGLAVFRGRNL